MTLIGFNYTTDTANPLTDKGKRAGWLFTLRGFTSLTLLEASAHALSRTSFDEIKLEADILEDLNPSKNKMKGGDGEGSGPRKRGRPSKEAMAAKRNRTV